MVNLLLNIIRQFFSIYLNKFIEQFSHPIKLFTTINESIHVNFHKLVFLNIFSMQNFCKIFSKNNFFLLKSIKTTGSFFISLRITGLNIKIDSHFLINNHSLKKNNQKSSNSLFLIQKSTFSRPKLHQKAHFLIIINRKLQSNIIPIARINTFKVNGIGIIVFFDHFGKQH